MRRFSIYLLVQIFAYAIDLAVFWGLLGLSGQPVWANIFSKSSAGLFAFFMHRRFSFRDALTGDVMGQALKYIAILFLNIPLSTALLMAFLHYFVPLPAKIASDVILVFLSFTLSRYFIFVGKREASL